MVHFGDLPAATGEWECMECGYVEEGVQVRRPKECPECGAPSSAFEFFSYEDDDDAAWDSEEDDAYEAGDDENDEELEDDEY